MSDRACRSLCEIGGIVLGVVIALAIDEVADGVRHRVNAAWTTLIGRGDLLHAPRDEVGTATDYYAGVGDDDRGSA